MEDRFAGFTETSFEALKKDDRIEIGGQCVKITKIVINDFDELVLHFDIDNAKTKKRRRMLLVVPKGYTCYKL